MASMRNVFSELHYMVQQCRSTCDPEFCSWNSCYVFGRSRVRILVRRLAIL